MFIFAPLIKCSDNLRDLLQLFLLQFLDLIDRKKRYFIGSGSEGMTKTVKNARTKWRDSFA